MEAHNDLIWKISAAMRDNGETLSVPTLVARFKEAGVPVGTDELCYIMQVCGPRESVNFVPTDVATFLAKLLAPISPQSVLDPWVGMGLLSIPVNNHLSPDSFEAISNNATDLDVIQTLEGSENISFQHADPFEHLSQSSEQYDAILSCPPFGLRRKEPLVIRVGDEDKEVRGDLGSMLVIQSCLRLSKGGMGVFIVPNKMFFGAMNRSLALQVLEELGFRVTAAIELPAGTFHPLTSITSHIVVIQKSTATTLFTAKYVPDSKHQAELLKNLSSQLEGKIPSLGRVVSNNEFYGYSIVELNEKVKKQAHRMGLVPYEFGEIVKEVNAPASSKGFNGFSEKVDAVYLPQMASTDATTLQKSLPNRLKSYFQIIINPEIADAEFVAGLMNTNFGQLWRDSLRTGETIPTISKRKLQESTFYLPPVQSREIQEKVVANYRTIGALRNELNELEAQLWSRPFSVDKVQAVLGMVNKEDRFEDWMDTLPFPLASILWLCHTQGGSNREMYERKIHFFEALAEFLAVIHLSAFMGSTVLWPPLKERLQGVLETQSLSLERATFGTWKAVLEFFSGEARRLLNDEREMCFELYHTRNSDLIESITSKRLLSVIQSANALRNTWVGHTGVVRDEDAKVVNEKLDQYIEIIRSVMGLCWENYQLFLPGECKVKDGIYHYSVKKVVGARTPFPSENIDLAEAMEDGLLHLKSIDEQRVLKLIPLVKVMPSPKTEENACYFYNRQQRDGIRFLSYHFTSDSEIVQEFFEAEDVLKKITKG